MNEVRSAARSMVKVWDPLVRIGHWLLVLSVFVAWLTRHSPGRWHEWFGYASLVIVGMRLIWGWRGSGHARFADFLRTPRDTLAYAGAMLRRREPRSVGHNRLGGWMIVALVINVMLVGASGWFYTTDRYWGVEWVETLHGALTDVLLVLIGLHIAGVVYASWRHRENLIAAMFHGRKKTEDASPG